MPTQPPPFSPFPPLHWDDYFWVGEVALASWAGFQSRRGAYGSVSSRGPSDGSARLTITAPDVQNPPSPEQATAFQLLLDEEKAIGDSVLQEIFDHYPEWKDEYADATDDEEADEVMPDLESADQLRQLMGLSNVHILRVAKDGIAYVGFEFGCVWEREHGLGVMTHGDRVVAVGGADVSFLEWIAEHDAEGRK
jgi:hypothetical protein